MAHAFDCRSLARILDDLDRLATHTRDQEERLAALVALFDRPGETTLTTLADVTVAPAAHPLTVVGPAPHTPPPDAMSALRDACVSARVQRGLIGALCSRLIGVAEDEGTARTPPVRALVVDDSADNRDLASFTLETAGFHTITASNGLEGIIVAHYARPAVVLMDLTMPVLDGLAATRLLRASAVTRHLNVIAYTARADAYDGQLALLFTHVLSKPSTPEAMVAVVERFARPW
jgi:two-component system, cell cycle response regulator DivK